MTKLHDGIDLFDFIDNNIELLMRERVLIGQRAGKLLIVDRSWNIRVGFNFLSVLMFVSSILISAPKVLNGRFIASHCMELNLIEKDMDKLKKQIQALHLKIKQMIFDRKNGKK